MARVAALVLAVTVLPVWAAEIYVWRDRQGGQHFSNVPVPGAEVRDVEDAETAPPANRGEPVGSAAADTGSDFSTSASLRRQALERELRDTDRELRAVDAQLGAIGRVRTRNASGIEATGGIAGNAGAVRTDEEKALTERRQQLAQHAAELRTNYGKLREEVTARLGATPAWWIDVR